MLYGLSSVGFNYLPFYKYSFVPFLTIGRDLYYLFLYTTIISFSPFSIYPLSYLNVFILSGKHKILAWHYTDRRLFFLRSSFINWLYFMFISLTEAGISKYCIRLNRQINFSSFYGKINFSIPQSSHRNIFILRPIKFNFLTPMQLNNDNSLKLPGN